MNEIIDTILNLEHINGSNCWARSDGSIYNPIGSSTIDFLNVIGDFAENVNKYGIINNAIEMINGLYDQKTKLFKYSPTSQKLPCITAKIVSILKKNNIDTPFYEDIYEMFFKTQQNDGGWRCSTVRIGKSPETDASNPGTTLYVLDALRYRRNDKQETETINKGISFLLDHWVTRKPLGPCGFGIGTTFLKTEYPFYRYNIFYYVYALSFYEKARKDKRFKEIVKELRSKETTSGIRIENSHKFWKKILFNEASECELSNRKYRELIKNIEM